MIYRVLALALLMACASAQAAVNVPIMILQMTQAVRPLPPQRINPPQRVEPRKPVQQVKPQPVAPATKKKTKLKKPVDGECQTPITWTGTRYVSVGGCP